LISLIEKSMMSNLIPTTVIDKNGVTTTRHKRADGGVGAARIDGLVTPPSVSKLASSDNPIPPHGVSTELLGYDFESSEIFENVVSDDDGNTLMEYSEEFDDMDSRVPFLAGEDGVVATAKLVGTDNGYQYEVTLDCFDGNKGKFRTIEIPYFTGSGWKTAPKMGDVMSSLASDALIGEDYNTNQSGFKSFMEEMGYESEYEARKAFKGCREAMTKLKDLVGEVRYGDYLYGRNKSYHGYDSGQQYAQS
jgi:hypothetical protein